MIRVTPDGSKRREFARWAVRHRVNTVTSVTFSVPDDLFPEIPDELLVGARVDGQPYVTPLSPLSGAGEPDDESDGAIVDSDAADTPNDPGDDASTIEPEPPAGSEPGPGSEAPSEPESSEPPSTPDIEPSPFPSPFTVPALAPAPESNPTTTAPVSGVVPF